MIDLLPIGKVHLIGIALIKKLNLNIRSILTTWEKIALKYSLYTIIPSYLSCFFDRRSFFVFCKAKREYSHCSVVFLQQRKTEKELIKKDKLRLLGYFHFALQKFPSIKEFKQKICPAIYRMQILREKSLRLGSSQNKERVGAKPIPVQRENLLESKGKENRLLIIHLSIIKKVGSIKTA